MPAVEWVLQNKSFGGAIAPTLRPFLVALRLGRPEVLLTEEPSPEGMSVRAEAKMHWKELCERAVAEQDPDRLLRTIQELIEILEKAETGSPLGRVAAEL